MNNNIKKKIEKINFSENEPEFNPKISNNMKNNANEEETVNFIYNQNQ